MKSSHFTFFYKSPHHLTHILLCGALQMFIWKVLYSCVSRLFYMSWVPKRLPQRIHLCILTHSCSGKPPFSSRCILGIDGVFHLNSEVGEPHQPWPQNPIWLLRASTYMKAVVIYCLLALLSYLCLRLGLLSNYLWTCCYGVCMRKIPHNTLL